MLIFVLLNELEIAGVLTRIQVGIRHIERIAIGTSVLRPSRALKRPSPPWRVRQSKLISSRTSGGRTLFVSISWNLHHHDIPLVEAIAR